MLQSTSLIALSLRACSSLRCYASTTTAAAAAAGNATATTTTTTKRRRRSRADVVADDNAADSTSTSSSASAPPSASSSASSSSPDAWRASLPDGAPAAALAAALRRSLALSGTKPESALVLVADAVKTADDARAAFGAAAALRAARVERGQRGELRPQAHAALTSAAVRATAAEILRGSEEDAIAKLLAATLGRARQAGMPVGAKTFADAAWALQRDVKREASASSSSSSSSSSSGTVPLLASAVRGVLAASLGCRVEPTPTLAAALLNAAASAGGGEGAAAAEALAAEFGANGVRLSAFAVKALERARSGAAAGSDAAAPAAAAAAE